MLRVTSQNNLRARNIPRKRFSAPYKINKDLDCSPHIQSKRIIEEEVFGRKDKNLSFKVIPYYGDDLGKAQMRPYDTRKVKFWQRLVCQKSSILLFEGVTRGKMCQDWLRASYESSPKSSESGEFDKRN